MSKNYFFQQIKKISFKRYPVAFLLLFIIFFLLVLFFFDQFLIPPKFLLICCIILTAGSLGKLQIVLKDWFIFLSFLYLFDSLRGTIYILTCKLNLPVYTIYVIKMEEFLFGNIPSYTLQNFFLKGINYNDFTWFEKSCTVLHGTHFVAFLLVGLAIWIHKPKYFSNYKISFYLLTSLGIIGYFVIPTVPPWLASILLDIIPKTINFTILIYNAAIPHLSGGFDTNPIAAMPSLHAAFPILCSVILFRHYRWKASPFFLYAFLILFIIVYSGNHYIVDIIAGAILVIPCYLLAYKVNWSLSKSRIKNKHLIIGIPILVIGIFIGLGNRNQFRNNSSAYEISTIPKYIDFFNNKEKYKQNFHVQYYFGNYYLVRGESEKALVHFKQALNISKRDVEKKEAQIKIKQCYFLRGKKSKE